MISKISLSGMRALPEMSKEFSSGITVISGKNGSGKTTLLEAVFVLCQGFSFRARNLNQLVPWNGAEQTLVRGTLAHKDELSERALLITKNEITAKKDGTALRSAAGFFGRFPAVMMQPSDIELVRGAPEIRRKWMDEILCFLSPLNADLLRRYKRVLLQRNEWLHQNKVGQATGGEELFSVLSSQLASLGAKVWEQRFALFERASKIIPEYYAKLSIGRDLVSCSYRAAVSADDNFEEKFLQMLDDNFDSERRQGVTLVGPHKDDFVLWNQNFEMRNFGSQGQCRSGAIAMRFAAVDIACSNLLPPVLLLDDILAELDVDRRTAVSEIIREKRCQVFVATPRSEDMPFSPDDEIVIGV